ncbi:thiamine pyrophosphate-binding protein [Tundrisphaera lichenicola]|uniref:thiamine pyrophosphate-binding protein n=1 Tax=Tundrisphaera lichenicola TaxID=2029860 RepID=UPI003EB7A7BC
MSVRPPIGQLAKEGALVDLPLNRREALGVLGAAGAISSALAPDLARADLPPALPPPEPSRRVVGRMTGAQAAVAALCVECAPCIFGVPGAQNNEFWDAMKSAGMPYLLVTNEASASVMADGSARATGNVGVFSVVPGPGLTNSLTGIGEALLDSVPIVGLITDVDRRPDAPSFQVHSTASTPVLRPLCKAVFEVKHPSQIPALIHDAFRVARAGEPGPVAVVLPFPFLTQTWEYDGVPPPPYPVAFDESAYRRAVGLLSDRRSKVGIYAGMGCLDVGPALACAAEILQAPVATSVSGKGAISDSHPLAVGWGYGAQGTRTAEKAFKEVDIVLAVGVKYSENSTASFNIPEHDKVIHVDANPANIGRNVPACVGVNADSRLFFDRLIGDAPSIRRPANPGLVRRIAHFREQDRREHEKEKITQGVDPMLFLLQLRCALGPDELIFVDVTASSHWAAEAIELSGPRRYFTPANNQSMGWAIPAALGAQKVRPDRVVASISGDGCFLMSGLEMSTAARAGLPVKFFVLDDGTYHYMQMLQEPTFRRTTATEIARVDYAHFAAAMGLAYNVIDQNANLPGGVALAIGHPGPILTRVVISYEGREIRWLGAAKSSYIRHLPTDQKLRMAGRIAGRSLERHPEND